MKKIFASILTVFLIIFAGAIFYAQSTANKLILNYYRFNKVDSVYTAWVWQFQPKDGGGEEFTFEQVEDTHWLKVEIDLTTERYKGSTVAGFIVKTGTGWGGAEEPGGDRHIDLSKHTDGVTNVYIVQSSEEFYYDIADVDISNKIFDAYFTENKKIVVDATEGGAWDLLENGNVVESGTTSSGSATITPTTTISLSKTYQIRITFDDAVVLEFPISLRNLYDSEEFKDLFSYDGQLGVIYSKDSTTFRLWSPISQSVELLLYNQGHPNYSDDGKKKDELTPFKTVEMNKIEKGVFEAVLNGDQDGIYYTFKTTSGTTSKEFVDPYAYAVGANGLRGMVVDFNTTNPKGWRYDKRPTTIENLTDYIIYETHVRDLTTHETWGGNPDYAGTFLGLAQSKTLYTDPESGITVTTGLDHIAELGVNAVHFLPIFDYGYVDETRLDDKEYMELHGYNWGYMPENFNALQGSYSTNPFDGKVRINEFKQLVQAFHNNNIRIIMDVVYNHTATTDTSNFQYSMPGYYFRQNKDGSWSNGSGTGNETASDRYMFRKYMVDSIIFWATEYNISGFRFDLMGLHDIETMNLIKEEVEKINPTILIYGEPWTGGGTVLPENLKADKNNMDKLDVASFNDNSRNAIKAWQLGDQSTQNANAIRYAIAGGSPIEYAHAQDDRQTFHEEPYKIINYVSCHDNSTLRDEMFSAGIRAEDKLKSLQMANNSIVLTSQGIAFLHGGEEIMRSKKVSDTAKYDYSGNRVNSYGLSDNSYDLPDEVNQFNWANKVKYLDVHNHYRNMIAIRRLYPSFRLTSAEEIEERIEFFEVSNSRIAFKIKGTETEPEIIVIHNGTDTSTMYADKPYYRLTNKMGEGKVYGNSEIREGGKIEAANNTTTILVEQRDSVIYDKTKELPLFSEMDFGMNSDIDDNNNGGTNGGNNEIDDNNDKKPFNWTIFLAITIPVLTVGIGSAIVIPIVIKKKK